MTAATAAVKRVKVTWRGGTNVSPPPPPPPKWHIVKEGTAERAAVKRERETGGGERTGTPPPPPPPKWHIVKEGTEVAKVSFDYEALAWCEKLHESEPTASLELRDAKTGQTRLWHPEY